MNSKVLQSLILLFTFLGLHGDGYSQKLYSSSPSGSNVFVFDITDNSIKQLGLLNSVNIGQPIGNLVHIGNGEFIGITVQSPNLYGAIYKTDTSGSAVQLLYEFTNNNTATSSFVRADNGKLYCLGNTGTNNESAIYSFDPSTKVYIKEYEITGKAGTARLGGMIQANNGILYGVTSSGGVDDKGRIFSYTTSSKSFTTLYEFSNATGTNPAAAMIQGANGLLYGVTSYGGANDKGVIFSFDISAKRYSKLYDFVQLTGETPASPLYQASDGKLYGTTMTGGSNYQGVLYSFDLSTNTYTNLHNFFASEGYGPRIPPIEGVHGVLYGTTNQGGAKFRGSIYKFEVESSTFTKLIDGDNTTAGNFVSPFFKFPTGTSAVVESKTLIAPVQVFPNPASDELYLISCNEGDIYQVFNQQGQQVQTGKLSGNTQVSVRDLPDGVYTIQVVRTDNRASQSERFIK